MKAIGKNIVVKEKKETSKTAQRARGQKVDLGKVYNQKEQEYFKKRSSSNTIGGHYI